jgi:hypothetical protein
MHIFSFSKMSIGLSLAISAAAQAQSLSLEEAQKGVDANMAGTTSITKFKVTNVLGCLPGWKTKKDIWVCALMTANQSGKPIQVTFQKTELGWQALGNDAAPACAPIRLAETHFRRLFAQPNLQIKSEVDDGAGSFTANRGLTKPYREGPYRLMCRYKIQHGAQPETIFFTYLWHDGEQYTIDADVEQVAPG